VSGAILEAHAAERVRSRSLKDEITGLPNLRHFYELVQAHLSEPDQRHPFCLVVVLLTMQNVQSAIDDVVTGVRRSLRPADLLFSSTCGELVALLLNTDQKASTVIASRVARSLDSLRADGLITAARLGLACAPEEAGTGESLLTLARDRASSSNGPITRNEAIH